MALVLNEGEEVIPGYRLVRKLGRGGFGEAWQAEAPGEVQVALKFIQLDSEAAEPELRALKVIKNVRHPNLLDVQFALSIENYLVIASPLCDRSLADRLKELRRAGIEGLPDWEISEHLGELTKAVDFLNEPRHDDGTGTLIGIQHRDIKPQNIFLCGGSVRLADFGLAKILECHQASHTGSMTPSYVAPEVLQGVVTSTSDQYSLAVTYCELRGGRLPFTGGADQVIYGHLHKEPDLEALPPEERPIVARALAKDPAHRWSSCGEFEDALRSSSKVLSVRSHRRVERTQGASGPSLVGAPDSLETIAGPEIPAGKSGQAYATTQEATALRSTEGAWESAAEWTAAPEPPPDAGPGGILEAGKRRRPPARGIAAGLTAIAAVVAVALLWPRLNGLMLGGDGAGGGIEHPDEGGDGVGAIPPAVDSGNAPDRENSAGSLDAAATAALTDDEAAERAFAVLDWHCVDCHGLDETVPGLDVSDRRLLVEGSISGGPFVIPGRPEESPLYAAVAPGDHPTPDVTPGAEGLAALHHWIDRGAPLPTPEDRPSLGPSHVLGAVADYLQGLEPAERPHCRFFSMTHLHDDPAGWTGRDLRMARVALAKAINGLSWRVALVRPEPLDDEQTVFAVDLRQIGWEDSDWRLVLGDYPYGVSYDGSDDEDLAGLERRAAALARTALPVVRADWFVVATSRPDLYHALLDLPDTAEELERRIGVAAEIDLQDGRVMRAAVADSRKSRQARVIDRYESTHGPYWRGYGFDSNQGDGDPFARPLGPAGTEFAAGRPAFDPDHGDLLFMLPNGLFGSMIVDAGGNRIDAAPTDIVVDYLHTTGSPEAVNAISCIACHRLGVVPFEDDLRDRLAVEGEPEQVARRLIPSPERLAEQLAADRDRYLDALGRVAGPWLADAGGHALSIEAAPEPILFVSRRFAAGLDASAAAAELGLRAEDLIEALSGSDRLLELGLRPLTEGGRVPRQAWERSFPLATGLGPGISTSY